GSLERFFGILVEHYSGNFPVWLAPVQVKILTVSEKFVSYGEKILDICRQNKIRTDIDLSSESLGKKIRVAENEKVPVMVIVGDKEQATQTVAVRVHKKGTRGSFSIEEFIRKIKEIEKAKSAEADF
ncbi:MAG: His/Gly/Thr/Pro-type tRNA ligase C-terminal domain-containing protein, partial [Candidatus Omnitrophica bacterium]|nr:His/Gly/Thr/Pro-type tRNA ligase C-terminal domain-containing protein [Candidatus Omnitrophota bacterium]